MKNLSKEQEYLITMKNNHRVSNESVSDKNRGSLVWEHIRRLKDCERLNGVPKIKRYSTAEHCFYTGIIFERLATMENISVSRDEIQWVYRHDLLETVTGDVLYPAKNYNDTTKKYMEYLEIELVKGEYRYIEQYSDSYAKKWFGGEAWVLFEAADLLELFYFCREEIDLGNTNSIINNIYQNCIAILRDSIFESVRELLNE